MKKACFAVTVLVLCVVLLGCGDSKKTVIINDPVKGQGYVPQRKAVVPPAPAEFRAFSFQDNSWGLTYHGHFHQDGRVRIVAVENTANVKLATEPGFVGPTPAECDAWKGRIDRARMMEPAQRRVAITTTRMSFLKVSFPEARDVDELARKATGLTKETYRRTTKIDSRDFDIGFRGDLEESFTKELLPFVGSQVHNAVERIRVGAYETLDSMEIACDLWSRRPVLYARLNYVLDEDNARSTYPVTILVDGFH